MTEQQPLPRVAPFDFTTLERRQREREKLDPSDPRHERMFKLDLGLGYLDIYWGGYEYSYELGHIDTPKRFLAFLSHICAKDWEHTSAYRVTLLIRTIAAHFRWSLFDPDATPKPDEAPRITVRTTSAAEERAKLTPTLRYDVLLRDDFRCRACGFSVESGAHLHIDHIKPVSAGGRTEINNLQALCSICNHGKGARK